MTWWQWLLTWLAASVLTATAYSLYRRRRTPMARICRHQLRFVPHMPQWLACDTCHADFPHRPDCPGHNSDDCVLRCMTPEAARAEITALEAVYDLPAAVPGSPR